MKEIKESGTGCANCRSTAALVEEVAKQKGVAIPLQKVEETRDIIDYGVVSTPAVVIDGKALHAGRIPTREKAEQGLSP